MPSRLGLAQRAESKRSNVRNIPHGSADFAVKSTGQSGVDGKTVKAYIDHLEEAFLIQSAHRYDVKGKRYISTPLKYYFCDMGVRNRADRRYYVQSAFSLPDAAKTEQETWPFSKVDDSFKKVVVVKDDIRPWWTDCGVLVVGLWDFLLDEGILEQ